MNKKIKRISLVTFILIVALLSFSLGRLTVSNNVYEINNKIGEKENKKIDHNKNLLDMNKVNKNIENIFNRINKEYLRDFDLKKAEIGIYKGIMNSLDDPYSVYYSEDEFKELNEMTSGKFGGIGIQVSAEKGDLIQVIAPIKGTPGEKAGILSGDKIIKVENKPIFSKDLEKAVKIMRGEPGTNVNITLLREVNGKKKEIDLNITRAIINVDSVYTKLLKNNVGYIQITGFQEKTADDFIKAYEDLEKQGAKKIILDLRNNPGGLLDVTMRIADFLMDKVTVINVRYKNGDNEKLETKDGSHKLPMVTLINKGSASASEVLSGALKENGRSKIVGEKSFGKGVIQTVYPVFNNGAKEGLKLTVAEFLTPLEHKIHGVGISPDYEIKLPEGVNIIGVENIDKDTQLQKAIELLK